MARKTVDERIAAIDAKIEGKKAEIEELEAQTRKSWGWKFEFLNGPTDKVTPIGVLPTGVTTIRCPQQ